MGAGYNNPNGGYHFLNTLALNTWHMKNLNNPKEGGLLEDKDSYISGSTTAPAGVTGEQFITGSRGDGGATRAYFQYTQDGGTTTGSVTFTLDYWAHELRDSDTPNGGGNLSFEVIAFNDPTTIEALMALKVAGVPQDLIRGTGFISSGEGYQFVNAVDAATGFQTLQATLDLGTGFEYVGVVIGNSGFDQAEAGRVGETVSFDNLQVILDPVVVPEPSAILLLAIGGGALVMVRRRKA